MIAFQTDLSVGIVIGTEWLTDLSVLAYWGETFVFKNKGAGLHSKNKCQKCVLWLQDSPVGGGRY